MSLQEIPDPPTKFKGKEKYWKCFESWFGIPLTLEQRQILEAVAENQYTQVQGANGFGKTFAIVALALAFHRRHVPSSVVVTSGTYGKLKRTFCADAEQLHDNSVFEYDPEFHGEWKWAPNPHIDIPDDPTWQFEIASPQDAGELEGIHNKHVLVIVDEADKDGVDEYVIDSMDSLISDENDRMVVINNPPRDEADVTYDLQDDPNYVNLQYSTFDSANVQIDQGNREGDKVPGLTGLNKLKKKWVSFNGEEWPGYDKARTAHLERNDLDERWYRRHAGVVPPASASVYRPFTVGQVDSAFTLDFEPVNRPLGIGVDVARMGGDYNVIAMKYENGIMIEDRWQGVDHNANFKLLTRYFRQYSCPVLIDAQGEGSGLADRLQAKHGQVRRFNAGAKASNAGKFYDKWAEGMYQLGQSLQEGDKIDNKRLREEMSVAARMLEFEEKHYNSRGTEVLKCTPKKKLKEELGRSPDLLDGAYMANLAASDLGGNLVW